MEYLHGMVCCFSKFPGSFCFLAAFHGGHFLDAGNDIFQLVHILFCFFQTVIGEVKRASVMSRQEEETESISGILFKDILHKEEVVERLAHLFRINGNKSIVQPVIYEMAACASFGLGNFIFMVRENKIGSAAMEINGISQVMGRHGRAFNMPAWSSLAPRAFPERFTRLCCLPKGKVARVSLFIVDFNADAGEHIFHFSSGQFAIVLECGNVIINIAA